MRKLLAIMVAAFMLVTLSACGQSVDQLKEEAKFARICKAEGGRVYYGANYGQIACSFDEVDK